MATERTIFELSWGHAGSETQHRFFGPSEQCDCYVRAAERIIELDRDPAIWAAHVSLKRLPDSIFSAGCTLIAWTKTSDERPTSEGAETLESASA